MLFSSNHQSTHMYRLPPMHFYHRACNAAAVATGTVAPTSPPPLPARLISSTRPSSVWAQVYNPAQLPRRWGAARAPHGPRSAAAAAPQG